MKRSPFGAVSVRPLRLMLTPPLPCCTEETNTFCTWFDSPEADSTKNTRSLLAVSPKTPGVTRETSSRDSSLEAYCAPICAAHGEMKSESAPITAICGSANSSTGFNHAVSGSPQVNQITISESRQPRVSVSSTEMNTVSESSTGSARRARRAQGIRRGGVPRRGARGRECAARARREGGGPLPRRSQGERSRAQLEPAPGGARHARGVLSLRPAQVAEEVARAGACQSD